MADRGAVNPGPWCTFMFAVTMWMFSFSSLELLRGDNYLMYGVILAVSLPFWIKAGNMYYAVGDQLNGHMYVGLGVLFGGFMGFGYIALYLGHVFPALAMDERIFGVLYIVGGIYMLPAIPKFLEFDKVNCTTWLVLALWLFFGSFAYFFPHAALFYYVNVVCCLIVTVSSTWSTVNEVCLLCYGRGIPMGRPFKR